MSTRHETYLMLAVQLKVEDLFRATDHDGMETDDINLPWCGEGATGKIGLLSDGMNGEYALFGKVIAVATEEDGIAFTVIECPTANDHAEIIEAIKTTPLLPLLKQPPVTQLIVVTHYH